MARPKNPTGINSTCVQCQRVCKQYRNMEIEVCPLFLSVPHPPRPANTPGVDAGSELTVSEVYQPGQNS